MKPPAEKPAEAEATPVSPDPVAPDSLGPVTRTILAGIAMRAGSSLLRRSVDRGILGAAPEALKTAAKAAGAAAAKAPKPKRGLGARLVTAAATRIATGSVPGAIVVGGALLARTLHNHRKNRQGPKRP